MTTERSSDDIDTIRAELESRAKARATITYGEAATLVGRIGQGLGPILDAIRDEEAAAGRPDLGCLVVRADTGYPASVGQAEAERERALSVRKAVFSTWRSRV